MHTCADQVGTEVEEIPLEVWESLNPPRSSDQKSCGHFWDVAIRSKQNKIFIDVFVEMRYKLAVLTKIKLCWPDWIRSASRSISLCRAPSSISFNWMACVRSSCCGLAAYSRSLAACSSDLSLFSNSIAPTLPLVLTLGSTRGSLIKLCQVEEPKGRNCK